MNQDQDHGRRKDDARPAVELQWDRPNKWTLLLTGGNNGLVGAYGYKYEGHPEHLERVNVYAEGTGPALEENEQYRMQMATITTAALGYWQAGDPILPEFDTPALRDVATLYGKYAALHKSEELLAGVVDQLGERAAMMFQYLTTDTRAKFEEEWAEFLARQRAEKVGQVEAKMETERAEEAVRVNRAAAELVAFPQPATVRDALYPEYVTRPAAEKPEA